MMTRSRAHCKQTRLRIVTEANIEEILAAMRLREQIRHDPDIQRIRQNFERAHEQLIAGRAHPVEDHLKP